MAVPTDAAAPIGRTTWERTRAAVRLEWPPRAVVTRSVVQLARRREVRLEPLVRSERIAQPWAARCPTPLTMAEGWTRQSPHPRPRRVRS